MIKYFNKAFKITNDNIILITPLVLFLFIFIIYIQIAQNAPANISSSMLLVITSLFMVSAFLAGWFYMVKKAVDLDKQEFIIDQDKAKASFVLIKDFPVGIGEYFFSFIGASILLFAILFTSYKIGLHYIGSLDINIDELKGAFGSVSATKTLISTLSDSQLIKLNEWNILFLTTTSIYSFLTMLWPAQIIHNTKNPFIALIKSIRNIFKNPLSSIILFFYVWFIYFTISFAVNLAGMVNIILHFVSLLFYFYFLVYIVVLIFLYYDSEIQQRKENKDQSDSNRGSDGVGQDSESDRGGEDK